MFEKQTIVRNVRNGLTTIFLEKTIGVVEIWLDLSFVFGIEMLFLGVIVSPPNEMKKKKKGELVMPITWQTQDNTTARPPILLLLFISFFLLVIFGVACRGRLSAPLIISPSSW